MKGTFQFTTIGFSKNVCQGFSSICIDFIKLATNWFCNTIRVFSIF